MKTAFLEHGLTRRRGILLQSGNCRSVEENAWVDVARTVPVRMAEHGVGNEGWRMDRLQDGSSGSGDFEMAFRTGTVRATFLGAATQGFALLEIVLAIALFSIVAVGMTRALDQIAQTSKQSRQEAQVLRVLESVLAEVAHQPALKETTVNFPKSADGVDARASIVKVKLVTKDKTELASMFKVEAEAWLETGFKRSLKRRMETYVYSPHSP